MALPRGGIHIIVYGHCLLHFCTVQTRLQCCFVHSGCLTRLDEPLWSSYYWPVDQGFLAIEPFFLMYVIQHRSKWRNPSGRERGNKMNSDLLSSLQTHPPQQVLDASVRSPWPRSPLYLQVGLAVAPYLLSACRVVPSVELCGSWRLKPWRWVGSVAWVWTSSSSSSWMSTENMRWEIENSSRNGMLCITSIKLWLDTCQKYKLQANVKDT